MSTRIEQVAQALADAHQASWGGKPLPLAELCDAPYWRNQAKAAIVAIAPEGLITT